MSERTVFISYRRDATGRAFARSIKEALTHHGYDAFLDVDGLDAGHWAAQILTQVPKRAHFLLILTPGALDRCSQDDDWVRREFLTAVEFRRNIVPVREESVDLGALCNSCPDSVKALFDFQIATIQHSGFKQDIETLIERYIPPHKAPVLTSTPGGSERKPFDPDISRIVKYAPAELIGREEELKVLNDAWDKAVGSEKKRPHILTFVALGGEGKTSLVAKWAAEFAHQHWPGCDAAFAWSFYSQGAREQVAASSDLFLKEALTFFGDDADKQFAASPAGAFEKGQRLARIVSQRRSLLILDGLEPLQYAPASPTPGQLKDQGIAALLKGLAATSHGLCVVTTRYSLPDLKAFWQTTAPEVKLLRLSREAGVHLLKTLGVNGTAKEFEALVEDVKGHALTLNLLGTYLRDAHGGDIRKRDLVKLEEADIEEQGGHAFRVMDAYVARLSKVETGAAQDSTLESRATSGPRALALLRLLGLFDRPASSDCLAALWKEPVIPSLTEALVSLNEAQRNIALKRLEDARLLTVNRDASSALVSLDAHPLLREYFARQLREQQPDAWRTAHWRLYEHLCANTKEGDEPALEDLQPLYQAVAHGCQAGFQQEACDKIFHARIQREQEYQSSRKLGAFGSDLGAVACFFEFPWSRVSPGLIESDHAWLLFQAAFNLRALGRLSEALEPIQAALEMASNQHDWTNAAIRASNLSELELTLGGVAKAVEHAEQSVTYAESSGRTFQRLGKRTTHADALHQAGDRAEAKVRFCEAEKMLAEREPKTPLLRSGGGFRYCDLLLTALERSAWQHTLSLNSQPSTINQLDSCRAVSRRAAQTLKWEEKDNSLLDIALDHLTLGRAALYAAILSPRSSRREEAHSTTPTPDTVGAEESQSLLTSAAAELNAAVDGLRRAGRLDYLPRGLLTRAWLRFLTGARIGPESAQADLDEAWEIAERGPMKLHMADIHLHRARLFGGWSAEFRARNEDFKYPWESPSADLAAARKLIEQCGYWRRKEELEDAEEAARGW